MHKALFFYQEYYNPGITATTAMKIPSLLSGIILVPVFTVLMVCVYDYAPNGRKIYGQVSYWLFFSREHGFVINRIIISENV
jgi:hypothetical protein